MATKYARATGNWTTDATWSTTPGGPADTTKPTAADDAVLDAASGAINVTIDSGAVCRSLDCNGYTGTLTHTASVTLSIGDGTAGTGNRALRLAAGMTLTVGNTSSLFQFLSTSATVQTITTAGKTVGGLLVNGTGGSFQLADAVTATGTVELRRGTLDTNGQTISAVIFDTSNANTRTLTLGSSAITLSSTGTAWSAATVTNLTVTANTAVVTLTGAASIFNSGAVNWNGLSVVMSGSGGQSVTAGGGAFTVANFTRTGTATKTDSLSCQPFTVSGTLTLTGNSATNRLLFCSTVLGTARTITAATTSLTNVDFRDITAAGAAAWTGTSVGNALGNTGITFTTPVTRYAVATGNVSSTGTWSATSGGASGASVPLCHDTIVLNAASGAITVTNDMPRPCADLTTTGYTGTLVWGTACEIYGSVTLGSGMTFTGSGATSFLGRSSHTITANGVAWTPTFYVKAGTYTLGGAITLSQSIATVMSLEGGTFNDGGFSVSFSGAASSARCIGATVVKSGTWTFAGTTSATPWTHSSGTWTDTGTIVLSGATATDRTFAGGGKTYGTLTDQNTLGGKLTITGANTFGTINKTATVACTLALPTSSGITITGLFSVNGASGAVLTLTGDVTKAEGTVSCDYLAISSSDATGGATFYAGANSTDGGTNTGWIFGAPTGGRPFKGGAATVTSPAGADTVTTIEGALVVL